MHAEGDPSRGVIDEREKEGRERERVKFLARCSVMVFAWKRGRSGIYRDCFRIRKGGGKIRGCFEAGVVK